MTKRTGYVVGLVVFALLVLGAAADTSRVSVTASESEDYPGTWEVQLPGTSASRADARWARFEFQVTLPVGSQVELWGAGGGERAPWDSEDHAGLIDVWIVDERSQGVVLFDLTRIVKRASGESSFVVRVVDPESGDIDLRGKTVASVFEVCQ